MAVTYVHVSSLICSLASLSCRLSQRLQTVDFVNALRNVWKNRTFHFCSHADRHSAAGFAFSVRTVDAMAMTEITKVSASDTGME